MSEPEYRCLIIAHVLRWNQWFTEVSCPYCSELHTHLPTSPEDVHEALESIRSAVCSKHIAVRYILKYPRNAYEISEYNGSPLFVSRDITVPAVLSQMEGYPYHGSRLPWNSNGGFLLANNPPLRPQFTSAGNEPDHLADLLGQITIAPTTEPSRTQRNTSISSQRPIENQLKPWYKSLGFWGEPSRLSYGDDITVLTEWAWIEAEPLSYMVFRIASVYGDPKARDPEIIYRFSKKLEVDDICNGQSLGVANVLNVLQEIQSCFSKRFPYPIDGTEAKAWTGSVLKALPLFRPRDAPAVSPLLEALICHQEPHSVELALYMRITAEDPLKIVIVKLPNGNAWAVLIKHAGNLYQSEWRRAERIKTWRVWSERKTFAVLLRGNNLPPVCAVSGYHPSTISNTYEPIKGAEYSLKMLEWFTFPPFPIYDGGVPGRHHASHAEMLHLSYLIQHHLRLNGEEDALAAVTPGPRLRRARIVVSQQPCQVCRAAMRRFCDVFSFRLEVSFLIGATECSQTYGRAQ